MLLKTTPKYYGKCRNEKSEDKALGELINVEGVLEITAIEEGRLNMKRKVTMQYCFENLCALEGSWGQAYGASNYRTRI